ncbi:hypothetical protein [Actinoplanes rectilineatus]|uniref:hypothetical protein n=1 Tax=Actinoplanes rectilineatus TaxID=113571 RepID=UPI0012F884CF|nr:hypothetical protein [Actinoplanes rectilineatus]
MNLVITSNQEETVTINPELIKAANIAVLVILEAHAPTVPRTPDLDHLADVIVKEIASPAHVGTGPRPDQPVEPRLNDDEESAAWRRERVLQVIPNPAGRGTNWFWNLSEDEQQELAGKLAEAAAAKLRGEN